MVNGFNLKRSKNAIDKRPKAVEVASSDGNIHTFPSISHASTFANVSRSLVSLICKNGGGYSKNFGFRYKGGGFTFRPQDFGCKKGKSVIVTHDGNSCKYISISAASRHTGVPANRICVSCKYGIVVSNKFQFKYAKE